MLIKYHLKNIIKAQKYQSPLKGPNHSSSHSLGAHTQNKKRTITCLPTDSEKLAEILWYISSFQAKTVILRCNSGVTVSVRGKSFSFGSSN